MHAGLRTKLFGPQDYDIDGDVVGFGIIEAREVDEDGGMAGIVERVRRVVGMDGPVHLRIDIDSAVLFYKSFLGCGSMLLMSLSFSA